VIESRSIGAGLAARRLKASTSHPDVSTRIAANARDAFVYLLFPGSLDDSLRCHPTPVLQRIGADPLGAVRLAGAGHDRRRVVDDLEDGEDRDVALVVAVSRDVAGAGSAELFRASHATPPSCLRRCSARPAVHLNFFFSSENSSTSALSLLTVVLFEIATFPPVT